MPYKAVLFDLDGTLLNTINELGDSMNASLASLGFPTHDYAAYKFMVGDGMDTLARRALPEAHRNEETVKLCVQGMRKEYATRWQKSPPYDGVHALLDELSRRGVLLTILSNKPDDFTKTIMTTLFPSWRWAYVAGAHADIPKKPDPAGAVQLAREVGVPASEFLYVGDTNTDMWTANRAGMYALGALWGFRPADELTASGAKALLEKPVDVLRFL
ncbi:MAG TPA: HAD family hydrolase [Planctomycetota bacterium]|nr:HAD family hydrolase [Planctomycetota bacterium]